MSSNPESAQPVSVPPERAASEARPTSRERIAEAWRTSGVEYVLMWEAGYEAARQLALNRFTPEDDQALQQLLHDRLELVQDFGGVYQLYRLKG